MRYRNVAESTEGTEGGGPDRVRIILDAINDVTRFATRGCSATACDRVRVVWMGHQLHTIASQAHELPHSIRDSHPELPWRLLDQMAESILSTPGGFSADEMQRFVERELPRLRDALRHANSVRVAWPV